MNFSTGDKMKTKTQSEKRNLIPNIARIVMLAVAVLSTIAVVFPALYLSLLLDFDSDVDPLEPGIWAYYILAANLAILSFAILYYKKLLPKIVKSSLSFILNFEVSNRVALISLLVILTIYISLSFEELFLNEQDQWADFIRIRMVLEGWPYTPDVLPSMTIFHVKNFLLKVSETVFQNIRVVPFMGTISLLVVTYFFTVQLTKKRFAGLVAVVLTLSSFTFLRYDTLSTYANFWTLFYILSLYLLKKKWSLSAISFLASLFCKPITITFLPLTYFFIYNTKFHRKKKPLITISYILLTIILLGALFGGMTTLGISQSELRGQNFNFDEFLQGFAAWSYQLRFDYLVLIFYLPLTVALILLSKNGIIDADSILVLIGGTLLSAPLLSGFTGYNIFPYRYIPFIIFFAIGVGMLLSKRVTVRPLK